MKIIKETIRKSIMIVFIMTVLCGLIYPMTITGIAQLFFHSKSNGSIIEVNGKKYGSELLGQQFTNNQYLWGRVMNLNTDMFSDLNGNKLMYSSPSNISTASREFEQIINERVDKIKSANSNAKSETVPVDLVTSSGSGLDPHISYEAAKYQVERIAKSRNSSVDYVQAIIDKYTTNRFVGIFGEKVVNVLDVNLALDGIIN